MITFTGLSHAAFESLILKFEIHFDRLSPHSPDNSMKVVKKTGGIRSLNSRDYLALDLAWTRTRGGMFVLSMILE